MSQLAGNCNKYVFECQDRAEAGRKQCFMKRDGYGFVPIPQITLVRKWIRLVTSFRTEMAALEGIVGVETSEEPCKKLFREMWRENVPVSRAKNGVLRQTLKRTLSDVYCSRKKRAQDTLPESLEYISVPSQSWATTPSQVVSKKDEVSVAQRKLLRILCDVKDPKIG